MVCHGWEGAAIVLKEEAYIKVGPLRGVPLSLSKKKKNKKRVNLRTLLTQLEV